MVFIRPTIIRDSQSANDLSADRFQYLENKAKALNKSEDALINEWLSEKASIY